MSKVVSAWKQAGATRWALRCNPSSGNLHPTEVYLLIGALPGLGDAPGLYHYAPREHGLERRADCNAALLTAMMREFPAQAFLVGLSSIHWREAWKYGERAFRYCQHDVGHHDAVHLRYTSSMKTATIPSVRVEPELRAEVESLLGEGETLSEFVETSVRASVHRRRVQAEFIARGLRSRDDAHRTGEYVDAAVMLDQLQRKLDAARARMAKTKK